METPMKLYGLTLFERFLADLLTVVGWLMIGFAVVSGAFQHVFHTGGFAGGLTVAETAVAGLVLILGSSGLRQNRAALELAYGLFFLAAAGWLVLGLITLTAPAVAAGLAILAVWVFSVLIRRRAIEARFRPRYLNLRQFETMVQIADAMIDGNGDEVIPPIEVAANIDVALLKLETPLRKDILRVLFVVEWLLPLSIGKPFPFSALGTNERRHAVEKVIAARGLFRDVARFLKMLSCIGYYGTPEVMRSVGYVPFEERERGQADQTPARYPDPLPFHGEVSP